jgi:hypothetical protein
VVSLTAIIPRRRFERAFYILNKMNSFRFREPLYQILPLRNSNTELDPGVTMRRRISFESANLIGSPQDDVKCDSLEVWRLAIWNFLWMKRAGRMPFATQDKPALRNQTSDISIERA